jgi:hypothetical protein
VSLSEPSGQILLPVEDGPDCGSCAYSGQRRCSGPATTGSLWRLGTGAVSCHDRGRQLELLRDLARRWPQDDVIAPKLPELPPFVPELPRGLPEKCELPGEPLYCVSLKSVLDARGKVRYASGKSLRKALRLSADGRLLLLGVANDELLEKFWEKSEAAGSWNRLRDLGFEAATSLSFSVYDNDPRFLQIYNQDRNRLTYEMLIRLGIPTAPFIFWHTQEDLVAAEQWLSESREITTSAEFAQGHDSRSVTAAAIGRAVELRKHLRRPVRAFGVGFGCASSVKSFFSNFPEGSFSSANPAIKAISGYRATSELRFEREHPDVDRGSLVKPNLDRFWREGIRRRR